MGNTIKILFAFALGLTLFSACQKLEDNIVARSSGAYIRFFNDINYYGGNYYYRTTAPLTGSSFYQGSDINHGAIPALLDEQLPAPLLVFLVDPEFDAKGFPVKAVLTGDFIGTQNYYYTAQPDAIGDKEAYIQDDFPGVVNIIRGALVNGVNMSRSAYISPGPHRIVAVYRLLLTGKDPIISTDGFFDANADVYLRIPYYKLTQAQKAEPLANTTLKSTVVVDTTIDFQAGQSYTLKLADPTPIEIDKLSRVITKNNVPRHYRLMVRNDQYQDQDGNPLNPDSLYVRFINLMPYAGALPETFNVYHRISWNTGKYLKYDSLATPPLGNGVQVYWWKGRIVYHYSKPEKIATVTGSFPSNEENLRFSKISCIPIDSLQFPDGTYMAPFRFDQTKVNSQNPGTQLIVRPGVAQHGLGFSTHEFYLVRTNDINTGAPYDLATDPNFINGVNVPNPNILYT